MRTPALYALIFFAGGILLAVNTELPAMIYLGVAVIAAALAVIVYLTGKALISRALICAAMVAGGAFLTELQSAEFPSNHISRFASASQIMTVTGTVVSEPDIRPDKTFLTVEVDSLRYRERAIPSCGRLRLQVQEPTTAFGYRDRIMFTGYMNLPQSGRNPGAFDYRRYLAIRQISAIVTINSASRITILQSGGSEPFVRGVITPVREYIASVFEHYLPAEQAAVMKGFLIGDVRYISRDVYQRFKDTGTLHVLAASGANVAYVISALFLGIRLFRLARQYRVYLLIAGVVVFSFLAYNQPSVVRASVMAVVTLIGVALYRDTNWVNNISVAGLIILAFRPLYLYDLGFQLSFGAAFALILFMPALERFLPRPQGILKKSGRYFLLILNGSVVAQLGVIPVLIYNFHTVPLVSFLANLVVVPLVGISTTLGIILVFLSAIPVVSTLLGTVLTLSLKLTLTSIDYFYALPIPQLRLAAPHILLIICYYLGLQIIFSSIMKRRLAALFPVLLLVCLNTLVWKDVIAGENPRTEVTFLDTRDMTTVFIKEPDGTSTLINGGGADVSTNRGETTVLPFLLAKGVSHLDEVRVTTDGAGNRESIRSVMAGLRQRWPGDGDRTADDLDLDEMIAATDSLPILYSGDFTIALLAGEVPVQNLNNLPPNVQVLAADWRYLKQSEFAGFLKLLHVETLILTNYPSYYTAREPLRLLRESMPESEIYSVLESGGIVVSIYTDGYRVSATANR